MNLSDMVDKISAYSNAMQQFGYQSAGEGAAAWSVKYSHADGTYVEIRHSEWTLYDKEGNKIIEGKTPDAFIRFKIQAMSKTEVAAHLIKIIEEG